MFKGICVPLSVAFTVPDARKVQMGDAKGVEGVAKGVEGGAKELPRGF